MKSVRLSVETLSGGQIVTKIDGVFQWDLLNMVFLPELELGLPSYSIII